jgi:hypothetical protein
MSTLRSINTCAARDSSKIVTYHEAQGLVLTDTFTPGQNVFDLRTFLDVLSTSGLPGHKGACLAWQIPLGKDVIREVCQALAFELRQIEVDALGRGMRVPTVYVFVMHPYGYRGIHYS